jgi:hypothetical protein
MKTLLIILLISAGAAAQQTDTLQVQGADTLYNKESRFAQPHKRTLGDALAAVQRIDSLQQLQRADTLRTRAFRFTPLPKSTNRINGMALGVGLATFGENRPVTVNGFNLELNPIGPLAMLFTTPNPDRKDNEKLVATVNGLNISTMGFQDGARLNGMGISLMNVGLESNGLYVSGVYHSARSMNGLFISGIGNWSVNGKGLYLAAVNSTKGFKGVMLGVANEADNFTGASIGGFNFSYKEMRGVQIGLYNEAKKCRGLQIGLWNENEKRSMPIINW